MEADKQKALVIGFARTLVQCSGTGNETLTDQAFENLVTAVNTYISVCQFNEQTNQRG
jgi:hypothetical protein